MTPKTTKRVTPGSVLEIELSGRVAYAQFVGQHAEYGDVIYVFKPTFPKSIPNVAELAAVDGYIAFYSARRSLKEGMSRLFGILPLAGSRVVPSCLRRVGARGTDGEILTWIVEDREVQIVVRKLSSDQLRLPIASIWDHETLKSRISEGWSPERGSTS